MGEVLALPLAGRVDEKVCTKSLQKRPNVVEELTACPDSVCVSAVLVSVAPLGVTLTP